MNEITLTDLPLGPLVNICSYLDLDPLRKLSLVPNKKIHSATELALGDIAKALACPVDDNKSPLKSINETVEDLVRRVYQTPTQTSPSRYHDLKEIPGTIREIAAQAKVTPPTEEQVHELQEFIKHRDIANCFHRLANAVGELVAFTLPSRFPSNSGFASIFEDWINCYRRKLDALETLDLSGGRLSSIPEHLGLLTNLRQLDLSDNLLNSIPEKLGNLENLKVLNLAGNQLTSIPERIMALPARIVLEGNPLASTAEDLEEIEGDPIPEEGRAPSANISMDPLILEELIDEPLPVEPGVVLSEEIRMVPEGSRGYGSILAAGAIAVLSVVWITHEEEFLSSISSIFAGCFWE